MLKHSEGQRVPSVTFRTRESGEWRDVTSDEIFGGRTVVLFALPGAFTPTCSSTHLPRYEELVPELRKHGVDEVVCLSVNDAFVMNAWGEAQGAHHVRLLPDGNGEFSKALGMLVDKSDLGFGPRSWRYSMLVKDGVIEKMFIEPEKPGDPFEVSDADTMLEHVAPGAKQAPDIAIFTRPGCGHSARAKKLLDEAKLAYGEVVLGSQVTGATVRAVTGSNKVPQVFVGGQHVGGADELEKWLEQREA